MSAPRKRSQTIEPDDPDVRQAIIDLRDVAMDLRRHRENVEKLPPLSDQRRSEQLMANDAFETIQLRAERIGISVMALVALLNDELDERARRRRGHDQRPPAKRLMDAVTAAIGREADAHRALTDAQAEVRAATDARIAAEQAYAVYAKGRVK